MWVVLAFISALCLGFYDISKKIALRDNAVVDVLTLSVIISSLLLSVPLLLSYACPAMMQQTLFYVPTLSLKGHLLTVLKSAIVLSSWIFAYISLKHLPISVVSPMQATRPMWTLIGALLIFNERLNGLQWIGVLLAIGSILVFSFYTRHPRTPRSPRDPSLNRYYLALTLAILLGACSGLYDKYLMRRFDHNAVQVYYTFYQALMMIITWLVMRRKTIINRQSSLVQLSIKNVGAIVLISLFLVMSDNVYMLALSYPDSMIAIVSTIRRGGAVIGFAYGLLFLKEQDPLPKLLCMAGICAGLICLAFA